MHCWEGNTSANTLTDSHQNHQDVAGLCCNRRQNRAHHIDGHRKEHDPFRREMLSNSCTGNLRDEIAPEVAETGKIERQPVIRRT